MKIRNLAKIAVVVILGNFLLVSIIAYAKTNTVKQMTQHGQPGTLQSKSKAIGISNQTILGHVDQMSKDTVKDSSVINNVNDNRLSSQLDQNKQTSKLISRNSLSISRSGIISEDAGLVPWSEAQNIFSIGSTATVIDVRTGIKFRVKRTFGYNHADSETITADDTAKMKSVFGGQWTWNRHPVIVIVDGDGRWIAASMSGMPHAGIDSAPVDALVSNRSEGYGYGQNLDAVKGNNMDGHFDIHFLDSRTHGTNKTDPQHQAAVKEAAEYICNYQ